MVFADSLSNGLHKKSKKKGMDTPWKGLKFWNRLESVYAATGNRITVALRIVSGSFLTFGHRTSKRSVCLRVLM